MRHFSLKVKLTVLYTVCMILVVAVALSVLFSLSSREVLSTVRSSLRHQVERSLDDVELEDGRMVLDSDFYSLDEGVYLSLYDREGSFLYGRVPYGFNTQPEFSDGELRTIREGNLSWYVLDMGFQLEGYGSLYVRGILSIDSAEQSFRVTMHFALVLMPLLVILTAVVGYRFTRRTLLPVRKMTDTVQNIRQEKDLSRRVELPGSGGTKGSRDEIFRLAETFDEMLEELEDAFRREKQFTSDVSHELRTPVGVILAQCEDSLDREGLTEEQRRDLQVVQKKAKEMASMISQLLLLSRADEGRQRLNLERVNLSELTETAAEEAALLARERRAEVTAKVEPDIWAEVDETFYLRMLMNLLSNAISYGREGGHVRVALGRQAGQILGTVEDDGPGIGAEHLPHIFDRFYRADESRSGDGHSGLGLSMVKWIARAHGGDVWAASVPGKGSCFTFTIPEK